MGKPSKIGKNHVLNVAKQLANSLLGISGGYEDEPTKETVAFIQRQYPTIESFKTKYDTESPDTSPALMLKLQDGREIDIHLFSIKGSSPIQPKNLGAKSFLEKYFHSKGLQIYFNDFLEKEYKNFLRNIISIKEKGKIYDQLSFLKENVKKHYPKFTNEINPLRTSFLLKIREYCFSLLKDEYNIGASGIQSAFDVLMMPNDVVIITRHDGKNKCLKVEEWKSSIDSRDGIKIYKKGNDTIGIRAGKEALTIRFKFESGPTSSIKLATSYEEFPEENQIIIENRSSVTKFEKLIHSHLSQVDQKNNQDAIGKCNEAMIYYGMLKENPAINQTVEDEYHQYLLKNYQKVSNEKLVNIQLTSTIAVQKINQHLRKKYKDYEVTSMQLVTDSYTKDRLDTSDLQLILFVNQKYVVESLSLKAIARRNVKITAKNPGAGTLLGPTYFDVGSLMLTIDETKDKFQQKLLTHRQAQEVISSEIGRVLSDAPQENIKRGVKALLGSQTMVVTIYTEQDSMVLEYDAIQDSVEVLPQTPTTIQTTLRWNDQQEELSLRVKFSKGQKYGWSSIKLSCDYAIKYPKN